MTEDIEDGNENSKTGSSPKRSKKIRDLLTDRVVGIVGGALLPVLVLFIPSINKYLENSKEIQKLQIEKAALDILEINKRITAELIECQRVCRNKR